MLARTATAIASTRTSCTALVLRLESGPEREPPHSVWPLGLDRSVVGFPCNPNLAASFRTKADGSLGGEAFCAPGSVRPNIITEQYMF